jgi:hypothetical protein
LRLSGGKILDALLPPDLPGTSFPKGERHMRTSALIAVLGLSACAVAMATSGTGGNSSGGGGSHTAAGGAHSSSHGAREGHLSAATVKKETVAGRQAIVTSYKMPKPLSEAQRNKFHRAGFFEGAANGHQYLCFDTHYLLQSLERHCYNLIPPR